MKSKQRTWRRLLLAVLLAGFALVLFLAGVRTPSGATSPQGRQVEYNIPKDVPITLRTSGVAQSNNEREFEDKIPKHLPIKIKIQPEKERAAKDLNNGRWHHDLAFEVKNTGDKPIYYLSFFLDMPEIKPHGVIVGSHLYYGQRSIFGAWKGQAQPGDIPLRPNETIVLALDKLQADGWDKRSKIEKLPQPNKLTIVFQELNFGDGTGFVGGTGAAWPTPKRPLAEKQNTVPAILSQTKL